MLMCIRTDASREIGAGHLMRCLTLADSVASTGGEVIFICAPVVAPWHPLIEAHGHRVLSLPMEGATVEAPASSPVHAGWLAWSQHADAMAVLSILPPSVDWLVVDHYALDARWEQSVQCGADHLLVIDDLADRPHMCDILLDHNLQDESGVRYERLLSPDMLRLIGPRYALLRPDFAKARASRQLRKAGLCRLNVFMGGVDAVGATLFVLEALATPELADLPVDVIVGGTCPHLQAVRDHADERRYTSVYVDAANVGALMANADLAIGAGGVAALERCCVGVGSIAVSVAANQEPALAALARAGATLDLGKFNQLDIVTLRDCIVALRHDPRRLAALSASASTITDGEGTGRVVKCLYSLSSGSS